VEADDYQEPLHSCGRALKLVSTEHDTRTVRNAGPVRGAR